MHEYSVATRLLREVEQLAARERGRVTRVKVSVGEFSGVDPHLLQSAFEDLVERSGREPIVWQAETVPLEATCESCRHRFPVVAFRFQCPRCHSGRTQVLRGEELVLESVVLETLDECA